MLLTWPLWHIVSQWINAGVEEDLVVFDRLVRVGVAGDADHVTRTLQDKDLVVKLHIEGMKMYETTSTPH